MNFAGLVNALADPRAYVSAQEKRREALYNMGVEESDIVEVTSSSLKMQSNKNMLRINGGLFDQNCELVLNLDTIWGEIILTLCFYRND